MTTWNSIDSPSATSWGTIASPSTSFSNVYTYNASATPTSFIWSGGSGTITITGDFCAGWSVVSNDSWITILTGSSGAGSGTATFSVSQHTGPSTRTGTITAAGVTITITQTGLL
jgi:hypothetical protein